MALSAWDREGTWARWWQLLWSNLGLSGDTMDSNVQFIVIGGNGVTIHLQQNVQNTCLCANDCI